MPLVRTSDWVSWQVSLFKRTQNLPARQENFLWCRCGFDSPARKIWSRKWQPTPVFLRGKSHGQRSLAGCNPWGCNELDMTEWLGACVHTYTHTHPSFIDEDNEVQRSRTCFHGRTGSLLKVRDQGKRSIQKASQCLGHCMGRTLNTTTWTHLSLATWWSPARNSFSWILLS